MTKSTGGGSGKAGSGSKGGTTDRGNRGPGDAGGWPSTKPKVPSGGNRSNAPAKR